MNKKKLKNIAMISALALGVAVGAQASITLANNCTNTNYSVTMLGDAAGTKKYTGDIREKQDDSYSWVSIATAIPNYIETFDVNSALSESINIYQGVPLPRTRFTNVTPREQYVVNAAYENKCYQVRMGFYAPYIVGGIFLTSGQWSPDSV